MLRILLAGLHLLALGLGLMAVVGRGSALRETAVHAGPSLHRALRMDTIWGLAAGLWLLTGLWRLLAPTEKPTAYYFANHLFLAKMLLFVLVVALEIWPLTKLLGWRRRLAHGEPPEAVVSAAAARRIAGIGHVQALLVTVMIFLAVAMARGYGVVPER